jgi:uncharacterized membrane protein
MRSLQLQVRSERVGAVFEAAAAHGSAVPVAVRAERPTDGSSGASGDWSLVFLTLPNESVGPFVEAVSTIVDDADFILFPVGTLPLAMPVPEVERRVRDVSGLSTLELVLASLQSVGAWKGMLLYSVLAGTIGGYGLIFDISYLLVAAMLINPMGAPALVAVIGLAIGDARMFGRGGIRFLASLAMQAAAALALGFAYALNVSTAMMEQVASLSTWAVLVALAAGAAGAQTQVKSDRDSLVSGTASGFMVAAALAPPAAVLGLSVPLGRWDYFGLMAFLLSLQFFAIVLGGSLVLALFGVKPTSPAIGRGSTTKRNVLFGAIVLVTAGLVLLQMRQEPGMQKADLSRTALEIARDAVGSVPGVALVESTAHFTRRDLASDPREGLLIRIIAQRTNTEADAALLESTIRDSVQARVIARMRDVAVFVDVSVLRRVPPLP